MSFLNLKPAELRAPDAVALPDGRKRLTRFFKIAHTGVLPPELNFGWGTEDTGEAPDGWEGLRLVGRRLDDDFPLPGRSDTKPVAILTYEQIHETDETRVGLDLIVHGEDGGFDVVREWVQFSTGTYVPQTVSSSTLTVLAQTVYLMKVEAPDDGTVRRIKRTYTTPGIIATNEQIKTGGKLVVKTITSVKTVPSTPSGFTLIGKPTQNPDGLPVYTYTYALGDGLVTEEIHSRNDGLREVTHVALGTRSAPTGVVVRDDYTEDDGYIVYTVSCMQSAAGTAPTNATITTPVELTWTWPGRAKAYSRTAQNGQKVIDVFRSGSVTIDNLAGTMEVTYQTSNTLGSLANSRWQPKEWATWEAEWITSNNSPRFSVMSLPGYRSVDETPLEVDVDAWEDTPDGGTMFGEPIYGGTTAVVVVYGGPEEPDGNTYTFQADVKLAFTDVDGTKYYRKTVVYATIPAQPALPSLS